MSYSHPTGGSAVYSASDVALSNPANGDALVYNTTIQKWVNGTSAATVADGSITSAKIANATIIAADISASAAIAASQLDSGTQTIITSVSGKLDSTTATATYAPKASPTFTGTITLPAATPTVATQAATKGYVDTQIASVSGSGATDATTSAKGIVQLAGDLAGTAAAPTLSATTNVNSIISSNSTVSANTTAIATKAAKGANSDITSLSGLTTALSLAQGGTGATSASAALTSLGALAASQKAAVSGIASLDTSTLVPRAQLGTGTASSSTILYGDGAWRAPAAVTTGYSWTATKTGAYTAANGDAIPCDGTSSGFTITLPANLAANAVVRVKKLDSTVNAILVYSTASIDGGASFSLNNQYASQDFSFSGTTWYAV